MLLYLYLLLGRDSVTLYIWVIVFGMKGSIFCIFSTNTDSSSRCNLFRHFYKFISHGIF